jgi:DNA polymerase IIIc chi subunit
VTEIGFYHLTRTPLERALPSLLEKVLAAGMRAVVMAGSQERVDALNQLLWTYEERSFLPHGSKRDGRPERQPIWLTTEDENPNGADCLVMTDGAVSTRVPASEPRGGASIGSRAWIGGGSRPRGSDGRTGRRPGTRSTTGSRTKAVVGSKRCEGLTVAREGERRD